MKYGAEQEKQLMTELWSLNIKDSPLNFVKFAFPWGQENTPLEDFTGPREWQEKILRDIEIQHSAVGSNCFGSVYRNGR